MPVNHSFFSEKNINISKHISQNMFVMHVEQTPHFTLVKKSKMKKKICLQVYFRRQSQVLFFHPYCISLSNILIPTILSFFSQAPLLGINTIFNRGLKFLNTLLKSLIILAKPFKIVFIPIFLCPTQFASMKLRHIFKRHDKDATKETFHSNYKRNTGHSLKKEVCFLLSFNINSAFNSLFNPVILNIINQIQ